VTEKKPLAPLHATLSDLLKWLSAGPFPGIVIGGVAASILGRPNAPSFARRARVLLMQHRPSGTSEDLERLLARGRRRGKPKGSQHGQT
jgi:hypothetical protein